MAFNILIVSIVILLGIVFLLAEIFLLPGISVSGFAGVTFLLGGIIYAYMYMGTMAGNITLGVSLLLLAISFVFLVRSGSLNRIALKTEINENVDTSDLKQIKVGDVGTAVSRLNPMGKVMIGSVIVEGKSLDGEMIDEDSAVEVVKVDFSNVIVTPKLTNK